MKPSQCDNCRRHFMASLPLQAEMRHHAAIYGSRSAESELNERLEETHLAHTSEDICQCGHSEFDHREFGCENCMCELFRMGAGE